MHVTPVPLRVVNGCGLNPRPLILNILKRWWSIRTYFHSVFRGFFMRTPDSGKLLAFFTGENLSRKNISCPLNPRYSRVLTSWLNMPSFVYNICSSTKRPQKCKKFKRVSHIYYSDAENLSCHSFYLQFNSIRLVVSCECLLYKKMNPSAS